MRISVMQNFFYGGIQLSSKLKYKISPPSETHPQKTICEPQANSKKTKKKLSTIKENIEPELILILKFFHFVQQSLFTFTILEN